MNTYIYIEKISTVNNPVDIFVADIMANWCHSEPTPLCHSERSEEFSIEYRLRMPYTAAVRNFGILIPEKIHFSVCQTNKQGNGV